MSRLTKNEIETRRINQETKEFLKNSYVPGKMGVTKEEIEEEAYKTALNNLHTQDEDWHKDPSESDEDWYKDPSESYELQFEKFCRDEKKDPEKIIPKRERNNENMENFFQAINMGTPIEKYRFFSWEYLFHYAYEDICLHNHLKVSLIYEFEKFCTNNNIKPSKLVSKENVEEIYKFFENLISSELTVQQLFKNFAGYCELRRAKAEELIRGKINYNSIVALFEQIGEGNSPKTSQEIEHENYMKTDAAIERHEQFINFCERHKIDPNTAIPEKERTPKKIDSFLNKAIHNMFLFKDDNSDEEIGVLVESLLTNVKGWDNL